jgi:hypothetical protein
MSGIIRHGELIVMVTFATLWKQQEEIHGRPDRAWAPDSGVARIATNRVTMQHRPYAGRVMGLGKCESTIFLCLLD